MSFDIGRLRRSDQVVGVSAILFFIFLFFFDWYGVSSNVGSLTGVNVDVSKSGWDVFTNSRWVWLITIVVALASVAVAAGLFEVRLPIQASVIVAALGALSAALILYRIIHHPTASASFGAFHASAGIKLGIWLGLIAALAITYGGYLGMQAEGTSLADVRAQASEALGGLTGAAGGGGSPPPSAGSEASAPATPPSAGSSEASAPPAPPPAGGPSGAPAPPIPPPAAPPIPPPAGEPPDAASS